MAGADPDPDGSSGRLRGWIEPPTTTRTNVGVVRVIIIVVIKSVKLQRPACRTKTVWGKVKRKGGKEEEEEEKRGTRRGG